MIQYNQFGFINGYCKPRVLMSTNGMWVEKYRPQVLSEVINQTEIIGSLEALIKDPTDMPHLMYSQVLQELEKLPLHYVLPDRY